MKIKRYFKMILASACLFCFPMSLSAKQGITKQEIVYAKVNASGHHEGVYVVNVFDVPEKMEFVDYGEYESVVNLSDTYELSVKNTTIKGNVNRGKFFYQGSNPKQELPWKIELDYKLDGITHSPYELIGQSGLVEIEINISSNPLSNPLFSKYYLGQLTLEFDSQKVVVTKALDATLAYKGSIQLLNYTVLPGDNLKTTVTLDAQDFEMNSFNFSAIPFNMKFDLPDTHSMIDQLQMLENGIKQLGDGTEQLAKGIDALSLNVPKLYSGLSRFKDGSTQLVSGQKALVNGSGLFQAGLLQYSVGIDSLVSNIKEMGVGLVELKEGLIQIKDGSYELSSGLKQYQQGLQKYVDGIVSISDGHSALTTGIGQIVSNSGDLKIGGQKLVDGSNRIYEGLAFLDQFSFLNELTLQDMHHIGEIIDEILKFWNDSLKWLDEIDIDSMLGNVLWSKDQLMQLLDQIQSQLNSLNINDVISRLGIVDLENEDVKKLLAELDRIKEQLNNSKNSIENIVSTIDTYLGKHDSLESLVNAIQEKRVEINEKLLPLKNALESYDAQKTLDLIKQLTNFRASYKSFHDGLIQYTEGTNQLLKGIETELYPGAQKINDGLKQLQSGGQELDRYFGEFIYGADQIEKGLSLIVEKLNFNDLDQVIRLKEGIDLLILNFDKIADGQTQVYDGLVELSAGLDQYMSGFGQFKDGVSSLNKGSNALNDGSKLLVNSTNGMADMAKEQMEKALESFNKEGFVLESFVDKRNTNVNLVQFVYVSDSLKRIKQEQDENLIQQQSFWEKLLDIIIFWE